MRFMDYARHLYWKYEHVLDDFDKDVLWHGCIPEDLHLTDEEEAECERLWNQDCELGLVD